MVQYPQGSVQKILSIVGKLQFLLRRTFGSQDRLDYDIVFSCLSMFDILLSVVVPLDAHGLSFALLLYLFGNTHRIV